MFFNFWTRRCQRRCIGQKYRCHDLSAQPKAADEVLLPRQIIQLAKGIRNVIQYAAFIGWNDFFQFIFQRYSLVYCLTIGVAPP